MKSWIALTAVLCLALPTYSRLKATPQQLPKGDGDVKVIPTSGRFSPHPGQKGATYFGLEAQSRKVTTVFADGTTATAERDVDGSLISSLKAASGIDVNRVRVEHRDNGDRVVQYLRPSEAAVQAALETSVTPTLDWANRQSHLLHRDGVQSGDGLKWRDGLMRAERGGPEGDELATVRSIETVWANGFSAETRRVPTKAGATFAGKPVMGDVLVTTLYREGVVIGHANYFTYERLFAWDIPGLTKGLIGNEQLKARYGGWPFRPDMIWMNLQTLGMFQWKTAINERRHFALTPAPASWLDKVGRYFVPAPKADDKGCDDLHFLDGTNFRYCCDAHDACFAQNGCTASSWWKVWNSWNCDKCNIDVALCFAIVAADYGGLWY